MKKIMIFLLMLVLLTGMILSVQAADNSLQITPVFNEAGDTVYLTVSLTQALKGNTLGLTYEYSKTELTAYKEGFSWLKDGVLMDFRADQNQGAWACSEAKDLSGALCVLAFRLPEGFTKSEVSVTLLVKNGSEVLGEYQASTVVSPPCVHTYGSWRDSGQIGHVRICESCGGTQTESHSWDAGTAKTDPDNPAYYIRTQTCTVCGSIKTERIPASAQEQTPVVPLPTQPEATTPAHTEPTAPTAPKETESTAPVTIPAPQETLPEPTHPSAAPTEPPHPEPTSPTQALPQPTAPSENTTNPTLYTQPEDFNAPPSTQPENDSHTHDHATAPTGDPSVQTPIPTVPIPDLENPEPTQSAAAPSAPQTSESAQEDTPSILIWLIAGLILLAGAGVWLYRKKHPERNA